MVGKRGSCDHLMRRTTSMTRITVDLGTKLLIVDEINGHDHQHVSSKYHHRSSSDHQGEETLHFLTTCGLCNHRLPPYRDIYMYRGDTAFCSMECREQQMKKDERKEKLKLLVLQKKTENHHNYSELPSANSENSSKTKTVAAA